MITEWKFEILSQFFSSFPNVENAFRAQRLVDFVLLTDCGFLKVIPCLSLNALSQADVIITTKHDNENLFIVHQVGNI